VVNCLSREAGLDCRAVQSVFLGKARGRVLSLAVRVSAETGKPLMLIRVPFGVHLPTGLTLQFGRELPTSVPFQSCNRAGCHAEYAIAEAELGTMLKGKDLTISAQTPEKGEAFNLRLSTKSFEAAYAKIK
jgi:invasion protein IalB